MSEATMNIHPEALEEGGYLATRVGEPPGP